MKLALGTVQFGLPYGAFNQHGMPEFSHICEVLSAAYKSDIDLLDTAQAYGESESRIGLSGFSKKMKVVTKIPPLGGGKLSILDSCFEKSLQNLDMEAIYGLLFHRLEDVKEIGVENIQRWIQKLKTRGALVKWGVSIYETDDVDFLLGNASIDLIQLPLNIFDQRFLKAGHLKKLKEHGVEIHIRSLFLQGLLLNINTNNNVFFEPMGGHFSKYIDFLNVTQMSPLEACLAFVNRIEEVDYAVVGVDSVEQLNAIVCANKKANNSKFSFDSLSWNGDVNFLNPGKWKL